MSDLDLGRTGMAYRQYRLLLFLVYALVLGKECVSAFLWNQHRFSCDQIQEYNALMTTLQHNPCISDTQIWYKFQPLLSKSHTCLRELIKNVADYVESHRDAGTDCRCSHDFARDVAHPLGNNHDHYTECIYNNPNCEYLFNYFYLRPGHTHEESRCKTHYHVWTHLRDIRHHYTFDQELEMILHLSQTYSDEHKNVCKCHQVNTASHIQTTKAAVTTSKTTTERPLIRSSPPMRLTDSHHSTFSLTTSTPEIHTSKSTTKTPVPFSTIPIATQGPETFSTKTIQSTQSTLNVTTTCQKYNSLSNIAVAKISSHPLAYLCPSGNRSSSEAFVLVNCNVGSPENWMEGPNVMTNCDQIPTYTPIATFGTEYLGVKDHKGLSGIFLGCIPGGFRMAYQDCDTSATIKHIEIATESGIDDPNNYFVIV